MTDNETLLPSELKHFLDTCQKQAVDQGVVELLKAMPVIYRNRHPRHEQISYDIAKELRKSMSEKGLQSSYMMGLREFIAKSYIMLPADWKALFKLVVTPGQY